MHRVKDQKMSNRYHLVGFGLNFSRPKPSLATLMFNFKHPSWTHELGTKISIASWKEPINRLNMMTQNRIFCSALNDRLI